MSLSLISHAGIHPELLSCNESTRLVFALLFSRIFFRSNPNKKPTKHQNPEKHVNYSIVVGFRNFRQNFENAIGTGYWNPLILSFRKVTKYKIKSGFKGQ